MALPRLACSHHPDRIGRAECVGCHKVLCNECATPWEGIHYCTGCLARRRASEVSSASIVAWVSWSAATLLLFAAATYLMTWAGVFVLTST